MRNSDSVGSFIRDLVGVTNFRNAWDRIEDAIRVGDIAWLQRLYGTLAAATELSVDTRRHMRWQILERLALTAGRDYAECSVELIRTSPAAPRDLWRVRLASRLAFAQEAELMAGLVSVADLELSGCLLQEALVRGKLDLASRRIAEIQRALENARHPLARLPLRLFPEEANLSLMTYGREYAARSGPNGYDLNPPLFIVLPVRAVVQDVTTEDWLERVMVPFAQWSNQRAEARLFRVEDFLGMLPALLGAFDLACAKPTSAIKVRSETGAGCFNLLFNAAAHGGAYTNGDGSAYGRLDAWNAASALVGLPAGTPIPQIAEEVAAADWLSFDAENEWFFNLAWDAGIVCRPRGGNLIAVVAVTDED